MSCLNDHNNKPSMMRIGFMVSLILGSVVTLAGTVAMFLQLADAAMAMTLGAGLISSSSFAKAIQSKWENRDATLSK